MENKKPALSYDDVLLKPQYSDIKSRSEIEITAFSNEVFTKSQRLEEQKSFPLIQAPSSITYYIQNAFPINIVAAPLAYGQAQLIKTSIVFKFDNFFVDRTSRVGGALAISDSVGNVRDANIPVTTAIVPTTLEEFKRDQSTTGEIPTET